MCQLRRDIRARAADQQLVELVALTSVSRSPRCSSTTTVSSTCRHVSPNSSHRTENRKDGTVPVTLTTALIPTSPDDHPFADHDSSE